MSTKQTEIDSAVFDHDKNPGLKEMLQSHFTLHAFKLHFEDVKPQLQQFSKLVAWKYKKDKMEVAKAHGFDTILEAMYYMYWTSGTASTIKAFGITGASMQQLFKRFGLVMRKKGGVMKLQTEILGLTVNGWKVIDFDYEHRYAYKTRYFTCECMSCKEQNSFPTQAILQQKLKPCNCGKVYQN